MADNVQVTTVDIPDFEGQVLKLGLTQPFETITFRPFQLVGRDKAKKVKRIIVSMDKGTGKTGVALGVFEDPEVNKGVVGFSVLILVSEKGMSSYVRDIQKFPNWEGKVALIYGNKRQREHRWKTAGKDPRVRYFIITYAGFLSDIGYRAIKKEGKETAQVTAPVFVCKGQLDGLICDEFHRVFRTRKSKTYEAIKEFFKDTEYILLLSGSAVNKSPTDIWPALNILDRKFWSTFWGYAATWCEIEETPWSGRTIQGPIISRVQKWREAVRPYIFHFTAEMAPGELPDISRYPLDITLEPWQRKLHDDLMNEQFAEIPNGEFIFAPNSLSALHKLRTALVCPKALDPSLGYGLGIEAIFDDAQESELTRYAVFTPFRAPIPHLKLYLESRGCSVYVLQGGIGLDEQDRLLHLWRTSLVRATPELPSVILSTIKYAESWEIPEARYGYMLGYEWVVEDNRQAEARLRRLISPDPIFIQYVRAVGCYDEELLNNLIQAANDRKAMLDNWYSLKK